MRFQFAARSAVDQVMKFQATVKVITIVTSILVCAPAWSIDVVYRKSTATATRGEIVDVSRTEVIVKRRNKSKSNEKIPADDIVRIQWHKEPAVMKVARNNEQNGRFEKALSGYERALKDASRSELRADIEYLIARATANMAFSDSSHLSDAIAKLDAFRKAHPDSFRFYDSLELLVRAYIARKDFENAEIILNLLGSSDLSHYQILAQLTNAKLLLAQEEFVEAMAAFDRVLAQLPTDSEESISRYKAMFGKATCLQRQQKNEDAVALLEQLTDLAPPDEATLQAESFVRKGDILRSLGRDKEALLAYLHVDLIYFGEKPMHQESLYRLGQLWNNLGHRDRADAAIAKLKAEYPSSPWSKREAEGRASRAAPLQENETR